MAGKIKPALREARVRAADVFEAFPAGAGASAPSLEALEALLREAPRENPELTQTAAEKIARERGVIKPRQEVRDLFKSLGGSTKQGPRGPRKNCAAPSA